MNEQMTLTLTGDVVMPMAGIGTFLLSPDEAEASCVSALAGGCRLIDTANAYVNERAVGRAMKKSGLSGRRSSWKRSCGRLSTSRLTPWRKP